jgi:hypothetical protein
MSWEKREKGAGEQLSARLANESAETPEITNQPGTNHFILSFHVRSSHDSCAEKSINLWFLIGRKLF